MINNTTNTNLYLQIADDNTINTNRKIVDGIYMDTWAKEINDFTADQEAALLAIAYLTPYSGGDAVYTARVLLNINPDDAGLDFAKPALGKTQAEKENPVKVFPNPAKNILNIQFEETIKADAQIHIYNNMGSLVLSAEINKGNAVKTIDVSQLQSGLYFYSVTLSGEKLSSGKLTILNK